MARYLFNINLNFEIGTSTGSSTETVSRAFAQYTIKNTTNLNSKERGFFAMNNMVLTAPFPTILSSLIMRVKSVEGIP